MYAVSKAESAPPTQLSGTWVKSDGSEVILKCPSEEQYGDKSLKLPASCVSLRAGVWSSVKAHEGKKAEIARLTRELELTKATLQEYRENVKAERAELTSYFQRTSSELKSISDNLHSRDFSWSSAAMGFASGAAMCGGIAIGGAF